MSRKFLYVLICFSLVGSAACSKAESPSVNANAANAVNLDSKNMPPGFSTSPLPLGANSTPGIPGPKDANAANMVPTGKIPGIPDANKIGKTPQPKNTPRIPGIPDQETIRRQMNTPLTDANIVNNPPKSETNANGRPPEKPRGNTRQP